MREPVGASVRGRRSSVVLVAATSPAMPIQSSLILKGSTTIPASAGGGTAVSHGLYDLSGDPSWSFAIEFVAPTTLNQGPRSYR